MTELVSCKQERHKPKIEGIIRYFHLKASCSRLLSCQVNQPCSFTCFCTDMFPLDRWCLVWNKRDHLSISQQQGLHSVTSHCPPANWVCQCSATQLSRVQHDASPPLGERSWHKPYSNGIQKQRSVNEVLIAFIKTLTKELKWQKLLFPLKIHTNNQKYTNNHQGLHYFGGIIQREDTRAWNDHFDDLLYWLLYQRWDILQLLFIQICSFLYVFSPVLVTHSKNGSAAPHCPLKLLTWGKK